MTSNDTFSRALTLPSFRLEALDALLPKLAKKAAKLGVASPSYVVTREFVKDVSHDAAYPELVSFSDITISYQTLVEAGKWTFVASLETVDAVNGVNRNRVNGPRLSDTDAKQLITAPQMCEHCKHNRKRNQTYIVKDMETGKLLQVGSSCLHDFLGVDPSIVMAGMAFDATIKVIGEGDDWGHGSTAPRLWALGEVAAIALSLVAKNGFVSAADAEYGKGIKTGSDMLTFLVKGNPKLADWYAAVAPSEENVAAAQAIVERLSKRILGDYIGNPSALDSFSFKLGIILNRAHADAKDMQLFAAAVNREASDMARQNATSVVKNEWLPGACEGAKVEVKATVAMTKNIQTSFGNSLLVKFVTLDGYPLTTFYSGSNQEFNPGTTVTVKGTVKRLDDSTFGKATLLTRCKVSV